MYLDIQKSEFYKDYVSQLFQKKEHITNNYLKI